MTTILHISADFPDAIGQEKTYAIRRLVESSKDHRHIVYSLNRFDGLVAIEGLACGIDRTAVAYAAPPKGILMRTRLEAVARWIAADLRRAGIRPDLVHAHKLAIEGIVAQKLSEEFECRLAVSIQGDSDTKVLGVRRDLWTFYRRLVERADGLMSVSRWPVARLKPILGPAIDRCAVIPAQTNADELMISQPAIAPKLVSVFHLNVWRRKGADTLARAATIAGRQLPNLTIDIYGGGTAVIPLRKVLRRFDKDGRIRLAGPVPHDQVQSVLNGYSAFVMPSRRETYGLAYAEALFSGLPLIYSKGRGIDGMIPAGLGYACDPFSPTDVAAGIVEVIAREAELKRAIAAAQASSVLESLRMDASRQAYEAFLAAALMGQGARGLAPSNAKATASHMGLGLSSSS